MSKKAIAGLMFGMFAITNVASAATTPTTFTACSVKTAYFTSLDRIAAISPSRAAAAESLKTRFMATVYPRLVTNLGGACAI